MDESTPLVIADEGAFDKANPTSLYNLVPPSVQEALERSKNKFLHDQSPESLRRNIRHTTEYETVRRVRQSFWLEYNRAIDAGRKMQMTRVWQGITLSSGEFYNYLKHEHFAAFILTRPVVQEVAERELLELAHYRMREILEVSPIDEDGNLNPYAAKVQIELYKHIDERVQGGVVKKVSVQSEQKNLNVNINQEQITLQPDQFKKMEEIQQRLAEIEEQTRDIDATAYIPEDTDNVVTIVAKEED